MFFINLRETGEKTWVMPSHECVDRLKSKNIEMEDFTTHASMNPSYEW